MELYNNDCFEILPTLEENTIDLFILDLPYSNKHFGKCTDAAWDNTINLDQMWKEIKRIMKPHAVILFFCNSKLGYSLINSQPKLYRYDLIWQKSKQTFLNCNKSPLRKHELIYMFNKNKPTYNPQKTTGHKEYSFGLRPKKSELYKCTIHKEPKSNKTERFPTSILKFNNENNTIHPTQKPIKLLEFLIKSYSNIGDVVCDFCMGSGSTGIACINTERSFIGVEKDTEIFKKAEKRINEKLNL